ncbi:MAG: hypothetical protein P4L64_00875 [Caulobacteraceae bacterium]|nr:hypothetical protein [Caulobacteraceae bacterium]
MASYAYNPLSQRTGVTRGNGGSSTYGYDAAGRLTSLAHAMPTAGAASNVSLTLAYTAANQLQSRASSNSVYDWTNFTAGTTNKTADGLNRDSTITALSDGYDHNGSVTDDGTRRLTYDYENRITGATMIATSAVTNLAYDPLAVTGVRIGSAGVWMWVTERGRS